MDTRKNAECSPLCLPLWMDIYCGRIPENTDAAVCPNGDLYEGCFKQSQFHGYGKYTFSNGDYNEGEWRKGMFMEGKGKYTLSNGDVYEGGLTGFFNHVGKGKYTFAASGTVHEGEWFNDMRHGKQKYTYQNGDVYETYFFMGKKVEITRVTLNRLKDERKEFRRLVKENIRKLEETYKKLGEERDSKGSILQELEKYLC